MENKQFRSMCELPGSGACTVSSRGDWLCSLWSATAENAPLLPGPLWWESGQDEACKGPWKGRSRPFLSSQLWAPVLSLRIRKSAQRLLPSWVKARCWLYLALRRWILSASRQRIWWRLWLVPWPNLTLIGQPRSRKHGFRDCEFCVRMKDFSTKILWL